MSASIEEAVKSARYNESAVVIVSGPRLSSRSSSSSSEGGADDGTISKEIVLVATLDERNGGVVWQDAAGSGDKDSVDVDVDVDVDDGIDVGITRHIRTKKWIVPMLQDAHRNDLYDRAIEKACRHAVEQLNKRMELRLERRTVDDGDGDDDDDDDDDDDTLRILDIGSGTGLLAMIAAKHSLSHAKSSEKTTTTMTLSNYRSSRPIQVQVISVEMASAMARLARLTIARNNLQNNITVVEGHSCHPQFSPFSPSPTLHNDDDEDDDNNDNNDKKKKADICVSELLESGLLGEGILPALHDAWDRHLRKGATVVPNGARVYAQVLEGRDRVHNFRGPTVPEAEPEGHADGGRDGGAVVRLCTGSDRRDVLLGGTAGGNRRREGIDDGGILVPIHAEALFAADDGTAGYNLGKGPRDDGAGEHAVPLTDPTLVLHFDFTSRESLPPANRRRSVRHRITPLRSGTAHGVLFWWECDLWDAGTTYSTQMGKCPWQDHWQQCLFVFGEEDADCFKVREGEGFDLVSSHDDTSISFRIEARSNLDDHPHNGRDVGAHVDDDGVHQPSQPKKLRMTHTNDRQPEPSSPACINTGANDDNDNDDAKPTNSHITPVRALQLNQPNRLQIIRHAIATALQIKGTNATVLDVSDFSICAIAAALAGATKVTSLEGSGGGIPLLSCQVAQLGNDLPRRRAKGAAVGEEGGGDSGTVAMADFSILNAHAENITLEHVGGGGGDDGRGTGGGGVDIIAAEPYYEILEGWHIQEALNYYHLVRSLRRRRIVSADALSVPSYARIVGCAIEFHPSFVTAHAGLTKTTVGLGIGDDHRCNDESTATTTPAAAAAANACTICDFRHDDVDRYADRYHTNDMALNMREYRWKRLSNDIQLAKIPYEGKDVELDSISGNGEWAESSFTSVGTCHALVFWVEYGMRVRAGQDGGPSSFSTMHTGDRYHHQAVRMLRNHTVVSDDSLNSLKVYIRPTFGNCKGLEDHMFDIEIK